MRYLRIEAGLITLKIVPNCCCTHYKERLVLRLSSVMLRLVRNISIIHVMSFAAFASPSLIKKSIATLLYFVAFLTSVAASSMMSDHDCRHKMKPLH